MSIEQWRCVAVGERTKLLKSYQKYFPNTSSVLQLIVFIHLHFHRPRVQQPLAKVPMHYWARLALSREEKKYTDLWGYTFLLSLSFLFLGPINVLLSSPLQENWRNVDLTNGRVLFSYVPTSGLGQVTSVLPSSSNRVSYKSCPIKLRGLLPS